MKSFSHFRQGRALICLLQGSADLLAREREGEGEGARCILSRPRIDSVAADVVVIKAGLDRGSCGGLSISGCVI